MYIITLQFFSNTFQDVLTTSSCISSDGWSAVGLVKLATIAATATWRPPSANKQPGYTQHNNWVKEDHLPICSINIINHLSICSINIINHWSVNTISFVIVHKCLLKYNRKCIIKNNDFSFVNFLEFYVLKFTYCIKCELRSVSRQQQNAIIYTATQKPSLLSAAAWSNVVKF